MSGERCRLRAGVGRKFVRRPGEVGSLDAAKPKDAAVARTASVEDIVRFSNPYAPPEGTTFVRKSAFPVDPYPAPREPHPGLSISMHKDGGGHTTGGFGWNF